MRISELAARTGVPLATVKYYLREGLLMPGRATSATQAQYDDTHMRRLGLVRALAGQGLPLDKIKAVVALAENPDENLFVALGKAVMALPPYVDNPPDADYPRTRALLERLGQLYDPKFTAVAQLERALAALESAGLTMSDRRIDVYGEHIREIADLDVNLLPATSRQETVEAAVLGTALYEPVLAAMRRLAHQHRAARIFSAVADSDLPDPTDADRHPQENQ